MCAGDVVEAKCGAQIYVVVVDAGTGTLVQQGLEDSFLQVRTWCSRAKDSWMPAPAIHSTVYCWPVLSCQARLC